MSEQELYAFFLSLIVFVILTGFFTVLLVYSVRLKLILIRFGVIDKEIQREYEKEKKKIHGDGWFVTLLSRIIAGVLSLVFLFSMLLAFTENQVFDDFPSLKVVKSDSMSYKNKLNTYLFTNDLNDQFDTYDLVLTEKIPDEFDLKLYDVVVYDLNGTAIIHRIVEIIEPDETHPDHRYFRLQGDAVSSPDGSLVFYDQMIGIYRGDRVPFVGSIIVFLQSPAGWLCIILMLFALIAAPIVEKKLGTERLIRLLRSGYLLKQRPRVILSEKREAVAADYYLRWARELREELYRQREELLKEREAAALQAAAPPPVVSPEDREAEDRRLVAMFMQSLAAEEAAMQKEVLRRVEERKAAMVTVSAPSNEESGEMNAEDLQYVPQ